MENVSSGPQTPSTSVGFEAHFDILFKKFFLNLGLDKNPDLEKTPQRFLKALQELTEGYRLDPVRILSTTFATTSDDLVVIRDIPFNSLCEHHLMPFWGYATIGYVPKGKVAGLSKFPRAVQALAHRLQIQERLTQQVRDAIYTALDPQGIIVVMRATHSCMRCRGIRSTGEMITSSVCGMFKNKPEVRFEFFSLLGAQE